jgi:hypothetical protein
MHAPRLVKLQHRTGHGVRGDWTAVEPSASSALCASGGEVQTSRHGLHSVAQPPRPLVEIGRHQSTLRGQARGPGLTRQPSDWPSGPLHPMRVKTQSARAVCPADSPIVGWRVDRRNLELNELNALNEALSLAVRAGESPAGVPLGRIRSRYCRKGSCPGWSNAWSTKMMPPSKRPEAIESISAQPVSPARRPATPPHTPSESTPVRTITWMIRV